MEDKKVTVVNMVDAQVGIKNPDFRFQANWPAKGSKVRIDKQMLDDLMYEDGVKYLFDNGILYIDDMQDKIAKASIIKIIEICKNCNKKVYFF